MINNKRSKSVKSRKLKRKSTTLRKSKSVKSRKLKRKSTILKRSKSVKSRKLKRKSTTLKRSKSVKSRKLKRKSTTLKRSKSVKRVYRMIKRKQEELYDPENPTLLQYVPKKYKQEELYDPTRELQDKIIIVKGPHSYSYYNIFSKNIYIFGETHVSPVCQSKEFTPIDLFIKKIVDFNKSKKWDLFLETQYIKRDYEIRDTGVNLGNSIFLKDCFRVKKRHPLCPSNLRGHYIDIRNMIRYESDILPLIDFPNIPGYNIDKFIYKKINLSLFFPHLYSNYPDINMMYNKLFNEITPYNFDEVLAHFIIFLNYTRKINKQYDAIENKELVKKINNFFYQKMINFFRECENSRYNRSVCINMYIKAYSLIMDKYAIGRLFRKFKTMYTKNVIFYVGDAHKDIYEELFQYLGYYPKYSSKDYLNNCVSVNLSNFGLSKRHISK